MHKNSVALCALIITFFYYCSALAMLGNKVRDIGRVVTQVPAGQRLPGSIQRPPRVEVPPKTPPFQQPAASPFSPLVETTPSSTEKTPVLTVSPFQLKPALSKPQAAVAQVTTRTYSIFDTALTEHEKGFEFAKISDNAAKELIQYDESFKELFENDINKIENEDGVTIFSSKKEPIGWVVKFQKTDAKPTLYNIDGTGEPQTLNFLSENFPGEGVKISNQKTSSAFIKNVADLFKDVLENTEIKKSERKKTEKAIKLAQKKALLEQKLKEAQEKELQAKEELERTQQKEELAQELLKKAEEDVALKKTSVTEGNQTIAELSTTIESARQKETDLASREQALKDQIENANRQIAEMEQTERDKAEIDAFLEEVSAGLNEAGEQALKNIQDAYEREEIALQNALNEIDRTIEDSNKKLEIIDQEITALQKKQEQFFEAQQKAKADYVRNLADQQQALAEKEQALKEEELAALQKQTEQLVAQKEKLATRQQQIKQELKEDLANLEQEGTEAIEQKLAKEQEIAQQREAFKQRQAEEDAVEIARIEQGLKGIGARRNLVENNQKNRLRAIQEREIREQLDIARQEQENTQLLEERLADILARKAQAFTEQQELNQQELKTLENDLLNLEQQQKILSAENAKKLELLKKQLADEYAQLEQEAITKAQAQQQLETTQKQLREQKRAEEREQQQKELARMQADIKQLELQEKAAEENLQRIRSEQEQKKETITEIAPLEAAEKVKADVSAQLERMRSEFERIQEEGEKQAELIPEEKSEREEQEQSQRRVPLDETGDGSLEEKEKQYMPEEIETTKGTVEQTEAQKKEIQKAPPLPSLSKTYENASVSPVLYPTQQQPALAQKTASGTRTGSISTPKISSAFNGKPTSAGYSGDGKQSMQSGFGGRTKVIVEPFKKWKHEQPKQDVNRQNPTLTSGGYAQQPYVYHETPFSIKSGTSPNDNRHVPSSQGRRVLQEPIVAQPKVATPLVVQPTAPQKIVKTQPTESVERYPKRKFPDKPIEEIVQQKPKTWTERLWDFILEFFEVIKKTYFPEKSVVENADVESKVLAE